MAQEAGSGLCRGALKPCQARARLLLVMGAWGEVEKAVGWEGWYVLEPVRACAIFDGSLHFLITFKAILF